MRIVNNPFLEFAAHVAGGLVLTVGIYLLLGCHAENERVRSLQIQEQKQVEDFMENRAMSESSRVIALIEGGKGE